MMIISSIINHNDTDYLLSMIIWKFKWGKKPGWCCNISADNERSCAFLFHFYDAKLRSEVIPLHQGYKVLFLLYIVLIYKNNKLFIFTLFIIFIKKTLFYWTIINIIIKNN